MGIYLVRVCVIYTINIVTDVIVIAGFMTT